MLGCLHLYPRLPVPPHQWYGGKRSSSQWRILCGSDRRHLQRSKRAVCGQHVRSDHRHRTARSDERSYSSHYSRRLGRKSDRFHRAPVTKWDCRGMGSVCGMGNPASSRRMTEMGSLTMSDSLCCFGEAVFAEAAVLNVNPLDGVGGGHSAAEVVTVSEPQGVS
jgi:hypothetical protein